MFNSNLNWDRVPTKIKRAVEASLEHLNEHKFTLNDTNTESIDDYCWNLSKSNENEHLTCHCLFSYLPFKTSDVYEHGT